MNLVVGHRYTFDYIVREYCRANKMAMSDLRFEFYYKDTDRPEFDAKPFGSKRNGKQYFSRIASKYDRRGFWSINSPSLIGLEPLTIGQDGIIFSGYFIKRRSRIKNAPK
jgi:hypothetical protein